LTADGETDLQLGQRQFRLTARRGHCKHVQRHRVNKVTPDHTLTLILTQNLTLTLNLSLTVSGVVAVSGSSWNF